MATTQQKLDPARQDILQHAAITGHQHGKTRGPTHGTRVRTEPEAAERQDHVRVCEGGQGSWDSRNIVARSRNVDSVTPIGGVICLSLVCLHQGCSDNPATVTARQPDADQSPAAAAPATTTSPTSRSATATRPTTTAGTATAGMSAQQRPGSPLNLSTGQRSPESTAPSASARTDALVQGLNLPGCDEAYAREVGI